MRGPGKADKWMLAQITTLYHSSTDVRSQWRDPVHRDYYIVSQ